MSEATTTAVNKTITVDASAERAFAVFAAMEWWPLEGYSISEGEGEAVVLEPRAGGRWYERAKDGAESEWGKVVAFDAPERLVLCWQIGADWRYDPALETEVEVCFVPEAAGRTRVELEHRGLEAFGEQAPQMIEVFGGDGGWGSLLGAFAEEVESGG